MVTLIVFLSLCAGMIAFPYGMGIVSLGRDAAFIEAFSFGGMLVCGFALLLFCAAQIAVAVT
jgi:hypothetical protein